MNVLPGLLFFLILGKARAPEGDVTETPLIIAHRGSSGQMPEHTVEAYKLAVEQGADMIECDLAVTKDLQLVCAHEPWLSETTDVGSRPEFADRKKRYFIPSELGYVTDYFTIDFTLEELKTIRRVQQRSYRDQTYNRMFSIATLQEHIAVAKNESNLKTVGIYPETKSPEFFNEFLKPNDTTVEDLLVNVLHENGYNSKSSPCFIQSFDVRSLQYLRNITELRLVFLTGTSLPDTQLSSLASYVFGIGPSKSTIVQVDPTTDKNIRNTDFIERAHSFGLQVHPYTFRNEDQFMALDYGADPYEELKMFIDLGVDGLFSDFPATLNRYLQIEELRNGCGHLASKHVASFLTLLIAIIMLE